MSCWRCDVSLHSANDSGICRLCELEVDPIVDSLVRTWRYSEDRLFAHRGQKNYSQIKLEVYSTLLYTYVWKMRMVDTNTRKPINVYNGDYMDAAGYSMLANINAKGFLEECWQSLMDQGLVEASNEVWALNRGVPECTL